MKSFISCSTVARLLLFLSIPWSVLIDPIGGQPASSTQDHHQHRRSPMGFQGVRGRRSPFGEPLGYYSEASDPNNTTAEASALSSAKSVVGTVPTTEDTINASAESLSQEHNYNRALPPLSLTKRASRGFYGVRGKKDFELVENTLPIDSTEKAEEELWQNHQDDQNSLNKRIKVYPAEYTISPGHTTTTRKDSDIMVIGKYVADEEQDSLVKKNEQSFSDTWTVPSNRHSILSDYKDQERLSDHALEDSHGPLDYGTLNRLLDDQSEVYGPKIRFAVKNSSPTAANDDEEGEDEDDITIGRFVEGLYYQEPRSKKLFFNLPYRFIPKRTPSGFMGMRGKKLMESSYKRGPSGFMGMRGKKSSWDALYDLLDNHEIRHGMENDEVEKRAPANGFFGMRGKKWIDLGVDEVEKRSPSMGFFGMRGKKENGNYVSSRFNNLEGAKRSPQMGFHGMRGKRSVGNERSSNYGLFSVMKKAPYDFRGKFIGVRGKKSDQNVFNQYLDEAPTVEKRTPNGFVGMRGKKS